MDIIETKRLILRQWKMEDADSMFIYAKDPAVGPIAGWPAHKSVEVSKVIISHFLDHHPYCYAICEKDNINHAIGSIELKINSDLAINRDEAEIGYWLGKPYWGRGYMPEACAALIEYGFLKLGFNKIWGGYYDGNLKSKRVQEKLGFKYHHTTEGLELPLLNEIRIGHVNLLTKEDWLKNK
jgi:RimJ/RimL family protein N-acetyltransferase